LEQRLASVSFRTRGSWPFRSARVVAALAGCLFLSGIAINEFALAHFFSADGILDSSTTFSVRMLQATCLSTGAALLLRKRLVVLILLLMLSLLNLLAFQRQVATSRPDDRWAREQHIREVRRFLPPAGRVGYISDEMPFTSTRVVEARGRYYSTQYAVAPVVVEVGPTQELIVGYFRRFEPQLAAGLDVVHDFGDGLILFRKRSR